MSSVALEVRDLVKSFALDGATINAVDGVSFQVNSGEFVALVGPSGSGKTTMLSILAALLTPTTGQVLIDGQDLAQMNEKKRVKLRREKIGFTFQSNNLIPYLTARENVEFMLRLNNKLDRAGRVRSDELLARLGLSDRLHNLPAQMSGGQQQRVAIARALIHNPAVVLADEPTASLDTERAFQVVETFAHLIHENDRAGIMVTHDLRMCQFVDRVLQMQDGKLVKVYESKQEILELAQGVLKH
ncbi:ABC transporter ATP-binding protein [Candidatus Villigracilis saccharophilus]|uniref:ABC transporter ATP-binding protein n=1 Tax=Candidatus Villigracilis saccharophilus TaxID=3140684 RepID=UPI00313665D8|nr:ABC transporter ATP-binding protein [Anaerolineales bacterium]